MALTLVLSESGDCYPAKPENRSLFLAPFTVVVWRFPRNIT